MSCQCCYGGFYSQFDLVFTRRMANKILKIAFMDNAVLSSVFETKGVDV